MRYALHPTNCCPNPLDSEQLCKFQLCIRIRKLLRSNGF